MRLSRDQRNGSAVMVLECDQEIPEETVRMIENMKGIQKPPVWRVWIEVKKYGL